MASSVLDRSNRKVTVRVEPGIYAAAQEGASLGLANSPVAFIEEAVRRRSREIRHARLEKLAEEAMNDPGFVADMRGTMQAFATVDHEKWPPAITHDELAATAQEEAA